MNVDLDQVNVTFLSRGVATWLESGREKRNLGMAGLSAVLQALKQPETFQMTL